MGYLYPSPLILSSPILYTLDPRVTDLRLEEVRRTTMLPHSGEWQRMQQAFQSPPRRKHLGRIQDQFKQGLTLSSQYKIHKTMASRRINRGASKKVQKIKLVRYEKIKLVRYEKEKQSEIPRGLQILLRVVETYTKLKNKGGSQVLVL